MKVLSVLGIIGDYEHLLKDLGVTCEEKSPEILSNNSIQEILYELKGKVLEFDFKKYMEGFHISGFRKIYEVNGRLIINFKDPDIEDYLLIIEK